METKEDVQSMDFWAKIISIILTYVQMHLDFICDLISPPPFPYLREPQENSGCDQPTNFNHEPDGNTTLMGQNEMLQTLSKTSPARFCQVREERKLTKKKSLTPVSEEIFDRNAFSQNVHHDEIYIGILDA